MKVGVGIVNYYSEDLLESLLRESIWQDERIDVIICDNGSDNELSTFNVYKCIGDGQNIGYTSAMNAIVKWMISSDVEYDYFIALNPDVVLDQLSADSLIDYIESAFLLSSTMVVSPTILSGDGRLLYSGQEVLENEKKIVNKDYKSRAEVDLYNGAFAIFRMSVFSRVGLFRPELFMYYDELDFSNQVKSHGGTIMYDPALAIQHNVSYATEGRRYIKVYYTTRNFVYVFGKWYGLDIKLIGRFAEKLGLELKNFRFKNSLYAMKGLLHALRMK